MSNHNDFFRYLAIKTSAITNLLFAILVVLNHCCCGCDLSSEAHHKNFHHLFAGISYNQDFSF